MNSKKLAVDLLIYNITCIPEVKLHFVVGIACISHQVVA